MTVVNSEEAGRSIVESYVKLTSSGDFADYTPDEAAGEMLSKALSSVGCELVVYPNGTMVVSEVGGGTVGSYQVW